MTVATLRRRCASVDNRVSRHHAAHRDRTGVSILRDAGSTNGTTVNGSPIREHTLLDGDIINIGGVELRFGGEEVPRSE